MCAREMRMNISIEINNRETSSREKLVILSKMFSFYLFVEKNVALCASSSEAMETKSGHASIPLADFVRNEIPHNVCSRWVCVCASILRLRCFLDVTGF